MVIVATPEMEANAASLESLGAFLWLGGNRPSANAAEIKEAINVQFGIDRVTVVPHYPEDFFALFEYQHHRDRVTASPGRFRHAGLDIHSSNWHRDAHSDVVQANYHVHLCIEGIPLNDWSDSLAAQVLGPVTFVHYFDIATLRREDASCLRLWAWSDNPSSIPKVQRVTIAPRVPNGPGGAPSAAIGHRGFRRRAIVHLDRLEDHTPDANGQVPRRPRTDPFTWIYGVVDGEERPRDPLEPPPRRREDDDRHRRDDDRDRDDRRGRDNDRHRSSSWRGLFRSRSRAPEWRADEERRGDHSGDHGRGRDDRDRGRDGRRRACSLDRPRRRESTGVRGRSPPPSPRTTSCDVIQIKTSSTTVDWLRRAAPCFAPTPVQPSLNINATEIVSPLQSTPIHTPVSSGVPCTPEMVLDSASSPGPSFVLDTPVQPVAEKVLDLASSPGPSFVLATPELPAADLHQLVLEAATQEVPEDEASEDATTPIFVPCRPALLPSPPTWMPPRPPAPRRKTLAGVTSFNLGRRSSRIRAKNQRLPIATLAEWLLCQRMGIVDDGEQLTEAAISKFVQMFNGRLPDITIAALRALFNLDCDLMSAVENALIEHGGEGGPDLGSREDAEAATAT